MLPPSGWDEWRSDPLGAAVLAIVGTTLVAGLLGAALMWLSVGVFQSYGVTLFCLSPVICSFIAVILNQWKRPETAKRIWPVSSAVVGTLAVVTSLVLLLASAGEGIICVLMALPFAIIMAVVGAALGQVVVDFSGPKRPLPVFAVVLLLYPAAQEYEVRNPAPVEARHVVTQLTVEAPPAAVWAALMQPVDYPAATGWFRAGVVYPTRTAFALDSATGRRTLVCRYSQGLARLPIVAWEPGRSLTFAVPPPSMPAPMHELSPYPAIHAPHLHGYFQVDSGTFRLRPLPGGRTLLEARTVYRHSIGPQVYWQLWSNYLLDSMHERVLATLKTKAETAHE
jgi:uncharacterized protein YndB with AHSA1/START domain